MEQKKVNIEIDGRQVEAVAGQMLIEVTDRVGSYVPRFCYHGKLSVAANCRMCLVDVERAPKPLPACATPVTDGMKVYTRSDRAISAQRATMEFLLINHPLDCPICDQGGECELQDLALGFGRGVSRYTEKKRVVADKDLGPLVSTDMTRCIHCTRCVRFGEEIAGIQELGAVGRSEQMEIGTYIENSVDHELSGNIIDLCPVGALNNKPYRFSARAWEMTVHPLVSPHDCAGSNLHGHVLRGTVKRVVPRENEAINETWIPDRDRFSCHGIYTEDRLDVPMVKRDQEWIEVTWQEALKCASDGISGAVEDEGDGLGVLASPGSTLEELYLLRRIASHLGSAHLDHRLRRIDFRDQQADPAWPWLGSSIAGLERLDGILVVGSNLRMEVPIVAHRIRKAALAGAEVGFVNPVDYEYLFRSTWLEAPVADFASSLAGVLAAAAEELDRTLPENLASAVSGATVPAGHGTASGGESSSTSQAGSHAVVSAQHRAAARVLLGKEGTLVLLGHIAQRHPHFSEIRVLAAALAELTGSQLGYLSEGANSVGAALAGCLPHRGIGGAAGQPSGFDVHGMLSSPRRGYVLFGFEPDNDMAESALAEAALMSADAVVCFASYVNESLLECADVLLPIGAFAETAGTYVNAEGRWQSFDAAADPIGEARPGWRVLRVLGNALGVPDFDYQSAEDVRDALRRELGDPAPPDNGYRGSFAVSLDAAETVLEEIDVPIYAVDALVRHSEPLQQTVLGDDRDDRDDLVGRLTASAT